MAGGGHWAHPDHHPRRLAGRAGPYSRQSLPGRASPCRPGGAGRAIARELLALCPAFDCLDEYRSRCFVPGHWVTVCTAAETYAARAIAIDDNGALLVEREGGRRAALQHGEVSIRPTKTE